MNVIALCGIILVQSILGCLGAAGGFNVDPAEVRMNEIAENIIEMKGTIMGIAEYVIQIQKNVNDMQKEVTVLQNSINVKLRRDEEVVAASHRRLEHREKEEELDDEENRGHWIRADVSVDEILRREELAAKIERLFHGENITKVESLKNELTTVVENNFMKMLAALLITGPVQVQDRTPEIFRLMKTVLNGEMDFKPVVDRLPFLIRDSETNQFILLLRTLRETERVNNKRQFGGLEDIGKIIDAVGKFDLKEVSGFLNELPELFESIETIVDGAEEYF